MGVVEGIPIRLRLTLAFALAMAVVLAALGFLLFTRMESALDNSIERSLRGRADDVAALVRHGGIGLPQDTEGLSQKGQTFAQVMDRPATVVDSTADLEEPLLDEGDVVRAESGPYFVDRPIPGSDELGRLFVVPVDLDSLRRVVVVGETLEAKGDALESLLTLLWIGGPLLLLLSSLGAYAVAGRALRPVSAALARERRFVSDTSHELRTPLAALRTELELALRRERTREELEGALRSAAEEAERLSQLADDLLVLARSNAGKLPVRRERLAATDLMAGMKARFERRAAAAGRTLEVEAEPGLELEVDRLRAEQALGNLVENALRHGRGAIHLEARREDGRAELHVRDGGPGFESEFLEHAFEPFSRSDESRSGGGSGLGLAIVDVIARAHGGVARATSSGGVTDVWLELS